MQAMSITLQNRPLGGCFDAPPSKSVAHRLMIATVLAGGSPEDVAIPGNVSQDIAATAACLKALMASDTPVLDCGESGSTLRFLLPVAAALGKRATFTGRGRRTWTWAAATDISTSRTHFFPPSERKRRKSGKRSETARSRPFRAMRSALHAPCRSTIFSSNCLV